jgi:hypothetical protein
MEVEEKRPNPCEVRCLGDHKHHQLEHQGRGKVLLKDIWIWMEAEGDHGGRRCWRRRRQLGMVGVRVKSEVDKVKTKSTGAFIP